MKKFYGNKPFSQKLNNVIEDWFKGHKNMFIFSEEQTDVSKFKEKLLEFKNKGKITICTLHSDNTIFGDPEVNNKYRAWHDYIHFTRELDFSFHNEILVGEIHKKLLHRKWVFEKKLINCESIGQTLYYQFNGEFPRNQRKFTEFYLAHPFRAIHTRI